jgi:syntaxin 5
MTSLRDKTVLFRELVAKAKGEIKHPLQSAPVQPANVGLNSRDHPARQFNARAKAVNDSLMIVTERLQKLAELIRARSVFTDPTSEINKLTYDIKHDLKGISDAVETLASTRAAANGQAGKNQSQIVNDLQTRLAAQSRSFAGLLEQRTSTLREQHARRSEYAGSSALSIRQRGAGSGLRERLRTGISLPDADDDDDDTGTALLLRTMEPTDTEAPDNEAESFAALVDRSQLQLQQDRSADDEYLTSRSNAVEELRATIEEVAGLYRRVNELVAMQEEVTIRIDADIEDIQVNVEEGHMELIKYLEGLSSNQWLLIKVLAIVLAFALFFVTVIA